jgi:molecular chaperone GrpE
VSESKGHEDGREAANGEDSWRPASQGSEPSSGRAVPPDAGATTPADAGQASPKSPEARERELEDAKAEATKLREQLLRTAADFDNFRKRTRRDIDDATRKTTEKVLLEVLPVSDNLERAVQAAQQGGDIKSVVEGVTMVLRFLEDALNRLGVERVQSVGAPFDPSVHEAVQQVESEQSPGTVVTEMTPGYRLNGKLLRPAMVAVARGRANESTDTQAH